jgi:DNA transposition AAA+ family ATPase
MNRSTKLIGTGRMLIFDEAQRLMYNALETIMGLAEKTKFSMALITDTRFWEKITSGKNRGNYERLISRLTVKCEVLDHPATNDVTKIAKQFLSDLDPECIDYLTDIAASVVYHI